ncbi:hypothetical protein [Rhizobium rhizogenes]|uniref:GAP1-N1 domain-containing protein n=1 Tax=Rhizobium rhizogenes TaxID=359 RepID=UPI001572CEE2|nr:hypothetical protein [Rhizobium rhizogenes]NTG64708.1 hypothetical protein [Rhizobium rhizogenes]NTH68431.1 hypothetical protein [Rhizobium rhizogenes]NTH99910.1 hypothetical protein [Rhizobium rhizogenes]NTI39060.1 hypothetical protein [Rhizobium rhizogenes]NTJ18202.1 hypothetical protein [Rhizobium rhizogenes]
MVRRFDILKLDQALHGYADGHRELALSAALKPRDQKTLLSLSDISGPGAKLDETGYLTGYPLTESGFYALARTWPAPEMPRPGCVWTHTLLIDFADLASLSQPEQLLELFHRPDGGFPIAKYSKRMSRPSLDGGDTVDVDDSWVRPILAALYAHAPKMVVARRPDDISCDRTVVALWGQQWPRLRRSFRFCTLSFSDRSSDNNVFDLQLVPPHDSGRTRFSGALNVEIMPPSQESWIDDAVTDLRRPNSDGLRDFLRRSGSDVTSGRKGFSALCRLFRALSFVDSGVSMERAIAILQNELGTNEAGSLRAVVINQAITHVDSLNDQTFEFLWSQRAAIEEGALRSHAAAFGSAIWRRDPALLQTLSSEQGIFDEVVDRTIGSIDISQLIGGLPAAPDLLNRALVARPEIVREAAFWKQNDEPLAFECALTNKMEASAVEAMMRTTRTDLAGRAVANFGARIVLDQVRVRTEIGDGPDPTWLRACIQHPISIAEFLSGTRDIPLNMLVQLARYLAPDTVPNEIGVDPWALALEGAVGTISPEEELLLSTFLLCRALGNRSRAKARLMRMSFQRVYEAAAENRLTVDEWLMLEGRLPTSLFWFSWDRCKRLRAGAAEVFLGDVVDPEAFAWVVQDDRLFQLLTEEVASKAGGRRFLKSVRQVLKTAENLSARRRFEIVDRTLA